MFNATDLFKERLIAHVKLLNRYLRYIFNGHFMIALLFMLITLVVYYQKWLETISDEFPAAIVIALILGFTVSYNPIQSFLNEPDKVFLIVKETKMYRYFRLALAYNYIVQLYMVVAALAVIGPLYMTIFDTKSKRDFILLVILTLLIKGWNLVTNWIMFKVRNRTVLQLDKLLRTLLSIALLYFFLKGTFVIPFAILYFIVILNDYFLSRKQSGITWDVLIENDQHRLAVFYRFVSMFANVPQTTKRLKKRKLLTKWVERSIPFRQSAMYSYLYRLTFIRSNDYLNLYIRLTVIGGVIIYFMPNSWLKIAFALLFLYMTSFQLVPLYHHYRTSIWIDLYPVNKASQRNAYLQAMKQLSLIQTIIFSLLFVIWFNLLGMMITFISGSLFVYLFYNTYVKKNIAAK